MSSTASNEYIPLPFTKPNACAYVFVTHSVILTCKTSTSTFQLERKDGGHKTFNGFGGDSRAWFRSTPNKQRYLLSPIATKRLCSPNRSLMTLKQCNLPSRRELYTAIIDTPISECVHFQCFEDKSLIIILDHKSVIAWERNKQDLGGGDTCSSILLPGWTCKQLISCADHAQIMDSTNV